MKHFVLVLLLILALLSAGCPGNKAAELFKTAEFEELQNNREHAIQLYSEIMKKYPESTYAQKAQERLERLRKE